VILRFGIYNFFVKFQSAAYPPPANSYTVYRRLATDPDVGGSYTTIGTPVWNATLSRWVIADVTAVDATVAVTAEVYVKVVVDADGLEYDHISYDASVPPVEVSTNQPQSAQEYVGYKFIMYRDGTDPSLGPIMKGYQAKATIATPRQRVMRFPVYCYDVETDRYNVQVGYEGRAFTRIGQLESIEENGDVVTWQDLTTGESRQCIIEQISFTRLTPPDRGFTGYGGIIEITIRTV